MPAKSQKTQVKKIELLKTMGWLELNVKGNLAMWRWRDPKTKALHTLEDAYAIISSRLRP